MLDSWTASHLSACRQTPGSCYSSILNFTWLATPPSSTHRTCRTVQYIFISGCSQSVLKLRKKTMKSQLAGWRIIPCCPCIKPSLMYSGWRKINIFYILFYILYSIYLVHRFDPFKSFWRNCTFQSQRRLGSTRAPGQGLPFSWRMVLYIYYITAAGILSSCWTVGPPRISPPADRLLVPVTLVY